MTTRYWLQTQAPAGNWVDNTGSSNVSYCESHGRFLLERGETVRVIERTDREIWRPVTFEQHASLSTDPAGYAARVRELEAKGMTTSDAQGCADVEFRNFSKSSK